MAGLKLSRLSVAFLLYIGLPPLVIHCADYCHQITTSADCSYRDVRCFEMFSGVAEVAGGFRRLGEKSLTFDKSSKKLEDILSVHGFFQCLQHTLRLEEFGLLFSGVPCNSFTWISSSQHQRAEWNDFMGDTSYEWVEMMNIVAVRTAICLAVALARKCYFMIENPRQSTLPNFPYYDYLLQVANCLDILAGHCDQLQCTYWWMSGYGHWCCKPSLSIANVPWLAAIADRAGKMTRDQQRLLKQFQEDCGREVTKVKKTPGKSSVSGGKNLRDTSSYPRSFGDHIARLHLVVMAAPCSSSLQRIHLQKFVDDRLCPQPGSPLRWCQDAKLDDIKDFLLGEVARGNFQPDPDLPGLDG